MSDIDGVAAYPNYRFGLVVRFPDGETSNISEHRMFREAPDPDMLDRELEAWVDIGLRHERPSGAFLERGAVVEQQEATFLHDETWCQAWFSHTSLNVRLSDDDLRADFFRYISRETARGRKRFPDDPRMWTSGLMGAEEIWRWAGPCRCEHCVRREVVKIGH